jgi:hypothetical protein
VAEGQRKPSRHCLSVFFLFSNLRRAFRSVPPIPSLKEMCVHACLLFACNARHASGASPINARARPRTAFLM